MACSIVALKMISGDIQFSSQRKSKHTAIRNMTNNNLKFEGMAIISMHIYVIYVLTNGHWILGIGMVVSEIYSTKSFRCPIRQFCPIWASSKIPKSVHILTQQELSMVFKPWKLSKQCHRYPQTKLAERRKKELRPRYYVAWTTYTGL